MMHNLCPYYKQVSSYNVSKYPIFHSIKVYGAIRLYEYIVQGLKLTLANSQNASWNSGLRVENIGTRKKLRYFI